MAAGAPDGARRATAQIAAAGQDLCDLRKQARNAAKHLSSNRPDGRITGAHDSRKAGWSPWQIGVSGGVTTTEYSDDARAVAALRRPHHLRVRLRGAGGAGQAAAPTVAWHGYRDPVGHGAGDGEGRLRRGAGPRRSHPGAGDDDAVCSIRLVGSHRILDDGTGPNRALGIDTAPAGRKLLATGYAIQGACDPPNAKTRKGSAGFMKTPGAAAIEETSVFTFAIGKVAGRALSSRDAASHRAAAAEA